MGIAKPITLQDLASRLGISKVTVSRALRGQPDIGKETAKKVIALADELGYRPNILARKLASKQTRTIGLVVPKIAHHFLTQVIDSIYKLANKLDYEIVMMVSEEDQVLERKHIETLISMRVDGLLVSIAENTSNYEIFEQVATSRTPLVFFDRVVQDIGFTTISCDDKAGAAELVNYAIGRGYRAFGHIGGYQSVSIGQKRYQGLVKTLASHQISLNPAHAIFGGFSRADGYSGMMQLHENGDLPEILFAVTYPVALGVLGACQELGIRIPHDMDLICFGSSSYNALISPSITGIMQPASKVGEMALERLLHKIENSDDDQVENLIVPVEINYAETCIDKHNVNPSIQDEEVHEK